MPELPDVAVFKTYLDSTALHRKIKHVEVKETGFVVWSRCMRIFAAEGLGKPLLI